MNTPLKTTPPIGTEQKSPKIGDVGGRSPWNIGGSAEYPELLKPGGNPWRSIRESEHRNNPFPIGIKGMRGTSAQGYPPNNTRRHKYSRCGTKEIPDIGINAEKDRSKVGGGTKTLFPNCRPRTLIQDQELKDKGPGLTCLGGKRERGYQNTDRNTLS